MARFSSAGVRRLISPRAAPPQARTIARRRSAPRTSAGRHAAKRMRWILHATDFSAASRRAFAMALDLARHDGAELVLVHALAPPAMVLEEGYLAATHYQQMAAEEHRGAQKRLDGLAARARRGGVRASTQLLDGHPYEQIVRAAQRTRADLVVLGTHGRTRLARLLLGSVARRVIGLAPCPVITVPG
jgi:nucleotide-binding universal stress UspA family protein